MINAVLSSFPDSIRDCQPSSLGNAGGFSGAQIWRGTAPVGEVCVRQWPTSHPTIDQLRWMHRILRGATKRGCEFLPTPFANNHGETIIRHAGALWEVTPWLPGTADLRTKFAPEKLAVACQALAQFHVATAQVAQQLANERLGVEAASIGSPPYQPSLGMQERYAAVHQQMKNILEFKSAIQRLTDRQIGMKCSEILMLAEQQLQKLPAQLQPVTQLKHPLQPCIRDIWHQHVLFEDNQLTGIVDYGAMRVDSVALDLARLLGSLQLCHADVWNIGTTAYAAVRPLSADERQTMQMAAKSATVLAGLNWIRWLAIENRMFENMDLVHERISEILGQLRASLPFSDKNER